MTIWLHGCKVKTDWEKNKKLKSSEELEKKIGKAK